eukprot:294431-Pyramimonas_sp.AAC.1
MSTARPSRCWSAGASRSGRAPCLQARRISPRTRGDPSVRRRLSPAPRPSPCASCSGSGGCVRQSLAARCWRRAR